MSHEFKFPDCQKVTFSPELSKKRLAKALNYLGPQIIQRLLCFALYLLGVNRSAIGDILNIPTETAKSIIKVVQRDGLSALEDRRRTPFVPAQKSQELEPITLNEDGNTLVINFGFKGREIHLSRDDALQSRTVLLSMVNSRLLSKQMAAKAIKVTPSYMTTLIKRFHKEGAISLVDQRQGQKHDYRVLPAVKGELIQQFAVDVVTSGRTSGEKISAELKERCDLELPPRTIRHHMSQLGLSRIKRTLPQLLATVKKTSTTCSS